MIQTRYALKSRQGAINMQRHIEDDTVKILRLGQLE